MRAPLEMEIELGVAGEISLEAPGRPDDACKFIGEGDRGLVVTASFLKIECPNAQPIKR